MHLSLLSAVAVMVAVSTITQGNSQDKVLSSSLPPLFALARQGVGSKARHSKGTEARQAARGHPGRRVRGPWGRWTSRRRAGGRPRVVQILCIVCVCEREGRDGRG